VQQQETTWYKYLRLPSSAAVLKQLSELLRSGLGTNRWNFGNWSVCM